MNRSLPTAHSILVSVFLGNALLSLNCTQSSPPATVTAPMITDVANVADLGKTSPIQTSAPTIESQASFLEFLAAADREVIERHPIDLGYRGSNKHHDQWNDLSPEWSAETLSIQQRQLEELRHKFSYDELTEENQINYRLFEYQRSMEISDHAFRYHRYPTAQMRGLHAGVITHLSNIHQINSATDAEAYISRLEKLPKYFQQIQNNLLHQASIGIIAPAFTFAHALAVNQSVVSGAPLENKTKHDNVIYADFKRKVASLNLPKDQVNSLLLRAESALKNSFVPAFNGLSKTLKSLEGKARTEGVWTLPNGENYYRHCLKFRTTTDLNADEIHSIGLSEVARIQDEMKQIMKKVQFKGSLQEFFRFTLEDPRFFYANTKAGKDQAIADLRVLVNDFKTKLDQLFITKPKSALEVRAVEPYREKSEGAAFYRRGAPDGSRPGIFYLNTYNMKNIPKWEMPALAYHEAIPGHHMQRSIGQELQGIPEFRRFVRQEAYTEGWGLYSELLPKEIGFYQDPYDDYGRLAMELRRACRLVLDTGLHHKKWTLDQAVEYMTKNMPTTKARATKSIQRYLVLPGQATAYKIGSMKILELRRRAKQKLGEKFDIRKFHDVILTSSQVPLPILEEIIDSWIVRELT